MGTVRIQQVTEAAVLQASATFNAIRGEALYYKEMLEREQQARSEVAAALNTLRAEKEELEKGKEELRLRNQELGHEIKELLDNAAINTAAEAVANPSEAIQEIRRTIKGLEAGAKRVGIKVPAGGAWIMFPAGVYSVEGSGD